MKKAEVAKLLTLISAFDSRTVGIDTVEAWFPIVQDVTPQDAVTAVRNHFATSTEYLMPAHVVAGAKALAGPRKLASDISFYCEHHWPVGECPKCKEGN